MISAPDGVLIRATGAPPAPETNSLRSALHAAGLTDTTVSIELIPSATVQLTDG